MSAPDIVVATAARWVEKAEGDLVTARNNIQAKTPGPTDSTCFHAQQSAEKYLKAFLIQAGVDSPFTHNLAKLAELCAGIDASFRSLISVVESLTPYAVEMRYDSEFWPDEEVARDARSRALAVRDFVLRRLPGS